MDAAVLTEALSDITSHTMPATTTNSQSNDMPFCPQCGVPTAWLELRIGGRVLKRLAKYCKPCEAENEWAAEADRAEAHMRARAARHREVVAEIKEAGMLGERFGACTFDGWQEVKGTEAAVRECIEFVKGERWKSGAGLILTGATGCGKSHLAAAVLNALAEQEYRVCFANVPELFAKVRQSFGDDAEVREAKLMEPVLDAGVTVLDDVGAEKASDWTQERIYQIVDYRYRRKASTILTSNLDAAGLEKAIGSRSMDRLLEVCKIVKLTAGSYRRRAK